MAEKIIDITEIETTEISASGELIVEFKKSISWIFILTTIVFIFFMVMCVRLNRPFVAIPIFIMLFLFLASNYGIYFPRNIPYLCIDSTGVSNKKKKIIWQDIQTIKYQITAPNVYLSPVYLCLELKNKKKLLIDVNPEGIDSTIEIIAAHIKNYWPQ